MAALWRDDAERARARDELDRGRAEILRIEAEGSGRRVATRTFMGR
jgi:hypothetical protein